MGNGSSKTITTPYGTMNQSTYSSCSWYNPFCSSSAQSYTYVGKNDNASSNFTSMFASNSGTMLTAIGSVVILICIVSMIVFSTMVIAHRVRRRRERKAYYNDCKTGDIKSNGSHGHKDDNNDSQEDLTPKSKLTQYKYKLRRLFSINLVSTKPVSAATPARYISVSDLEFVHLDKNLNQKQKFQKVVSFDDDSEELTMVNVKL